MSTINLKIKQNTQKTPKNGNCELLHLTYTWYIHETYSIPGNALEKAISTILHPPTVVIVCFPKLKACTIALLFLYFLVLVFLVV